MKDSPAFHGDAHSHGRLLTRAATWLEFVGRKGGATAAGLALTLAGSPGFALRASAHVALKRADTGSPGVTTWLPPWTVDADAVFALAGRPLGSRNRTAASYGFFGMGRSAVDTTNVRVINKNWSYGVGTLVPLGSALDLFGEWRWRMSKLVLPTARPKPPLFRDRAASGF